MLCWSDHCCGGEEGTSYYCLLKSCVLSVQGPAAEVLPYTGKCWELSSPYLQSNLNPVITKQIYI